MSTNNLSLLIDGDEMEDLNTSSRKIIRKKLFVFDWDDTLMPTSFFQLARYRLSFQKSFLQPIFQRQLEELETKIIELFEIIINLPNAHLYIVTNAIHNWVESSCKHFMPKLSEYLLDIKISSQKRNVKCPYKIISAQHKYGNKCDNRDLWKFCTFSEICDQLMHIDKQSNEDILDISPKIGSCSRKNSKNTYDSPRSVSKSVSVTLTDTRENSMTSSTNTQELPLFTPQFKSVDTKFPFTDILEEEDDNIYTWDLISVGDGEYEAKATTKVTDTINKNNQYYCNVKPKVVKFRNQPTLEDMVKQLGNLQKSLNRISETRVDKLLFIDSIESYANTIYEEENKNYMVTPLSSNASTPKN